VELRIGRQKNADCTERAGSIADQAILGILERKGGHVLHKAPMHNQGLAVTLGPDLSSCNPPERRLYHDVIEPTLAVGASKFVFPQYVFEEPGGRRRRIDFAIVTQHTRIACELDGYAYHAEGAVPRERFADDRRRQNELAIAGWKIVRFAWDDLASNPEHCRDQLRRAIIDDEELHRILARHSLEPHAIQEEALAALGAMRAAGKRKGLVVLATGLGKTFLSAFDAKRVGGRVLFVVHNNPILEQAKAAYSRVMPDASTGILNFSARETDADIVFANINSLRGRKHVFAPDTFRYIVFDEFHHGTAPSYQGVLDYFKPVFLLGMTATPERTDRESILRLVGNNLVYEMRQRDAIRRGFLTPFAYFGLTDNIDYSGIQHNGFRYTVSDLNKSLLVPRRDEAVLQRYRDLAGDRKTIGFCVSIEHAERSAKHFQQHGVAACAIHSRLDAEERAKRVRDFRQGTLRVAFARDIFNEGVDFPDVGALLFMRPTESKIIFTQQLGRGLRLSPGKGGVVVLDFIGNYIGADRLPSYLRDLGAEVGQVGSKGAKPVYEFDNGCRVEFEVSALQHLQVSNIDEATGGQLIEAFYAVVQRLQRSPSLAELQLFSKYPLRQYIEHFGSLESFVERLKRLDPDADFSALEGPNDLEPSDLGEVVDSMPLDGEEFSKLLDACRVDIAGVWEQFEKAAASWKRPKAERSRKVSDFLERASAAIPNFRRMVLLLALQAAGFKADSSEIRAQGRGEEDGLAGSASNVFSGVLRLRDAGRIASSFASRKGCVDEFISLSGRLDRGAVATESLVLGALTMAAIRVTRMLEEIERLTLTSRELGG